MIICTPANSVFVTLDSRAGPDFQDQHPALGLLGGDQAARFHDQRFDVVETPDMRGGRVTGSLVTTDFITFHSGAMSFLAIRP